MDDINEQTEKMCQVQEALGQPVGTPWTWTRTNWRRSAPRSRRRISRMSWISAELAAPRLPPRGRSRRRRRGVPSAPVDVRPAQAAVGSREELRG